VADNIISNIYYKLQASATIIYTYLFWVLSTTKLCSRRASCGFHCWISLRVFVVSSDKQRGVRTASSVSTPRQW